MNKSIAISVALLLLLVPSTLSYVVEGSSGVRNSSDVNYYEKGFRYNIQGWVYVHIEGEPYERGYQYGYLASAEIVDMINRWSNWGREVKIMNLFSIKDPERYWRLCKSKTMKTSWKQYPEEYKQEIRGIADGVKVRGEKIHGHDVEFEDIVTLSEMQACWFSLQYFWKRFHPLRDVLNGVENILLGKPTNEEEGFCSAFIATGTATVDGGIVAVHSTQPFYFLDERFNFIVDVQPSEGNRFIMVGSPPGFIWGLTQFYQNDKGIVLMESTLPQGPWRKRGAPIAVRARKAIQYSDCIDDVLENLLDGNNGLYECEWLIGDSKTGEIASIELALYNTPIKRTYNGFYWSCNYPHDPKVQRELSGGISPSISKLFSHIFENLANPRAEKFQELEKKYYGQIDTEIAKKIISTVPLCKNSCDGKITTTKLMENMGLLAHMGNPNGSQWNPTDDEKKKFKQVTELPASGWVEIYPSISKSNKLHMTVDYNDIRKTGIVLWKRKIDDDENMNSSSNVVSEDIVYTYISPGEIYALDAGIGEPIWNRKIGDKIVNHEVSKNLVVIGTDSGVCAITKETGIVKWYQYVGEIHSKPIIVDDLVITSCSNGDIYAFDIDSGDIKWNYELPYSGVISEVERDTVCIGSGDTCYCFNIRDREIRWKFETAGKITASPRTDGNSVYLGSWDGNVYAVDLSTGDLKWKYQTGWGIDSTPDVSDGMVFVGSLDNNFYALDEDSGDLVWYFTCKSAIHSSPAAYGEYVFFGCDDGRFYALDKTNGDLAWSFAPGYFIKNDDVNNYITTPILSDPVVENGIVYIGVKGNIYALDAQTVEPPKESLKKEPEGGILTFILFSLLALLGIAFITLPYFKKKHKQKHEK
jgi:outer membrane protein assembly factor BamB